MAAETRAKTVIRPGREELMPSLRPHPIAPQGFDVLGKA